MVRSFSCGKFNLSKYLPYRGYDITHMYAIVLERNIYFEMVCFLVGWGGLWHEQNRCKITCVLGENGLISKTTVSSGVKSCYQYKITVSGGEKSKGSAVNGSDTS